MLLKRCCLLIFGLLCILKAYTQNFIISGNVIDKHTEEPIPFANIYIEHIGNIGSGTTSDINGFYKINLSNISTYDTIIASAIGYAKLKKPLNTNNIQAINFRLDRSSIDLSEVEVFAGENPANIIFRKIVEHKPKNDIERLDNYRYEVYNKLEVDIDEINDKIKNNRLLRPFSFIYENIDSTSETKPFLPMFLTESLSDYYYRKLPSNNKEVIKATRVSGLENESITQFLGKMYLDFNLYDNWISILGQQFVSPVANAGLTYYKYEWVDSAYIDGIWCRKLSFRPKHKTENTFIGDFWVSDSTYAIVQISMQIANHSNINFVERLSIFQSYNLVDNKHWMLKKDKLIVDFISLGENPGLMGRKTTSYKNFVVNDTNIDQYFIDKLNVITNEDAIKNEESFWKQARHDSLSKNESAIYEMIDSIQKVPIYKTYVDIISTLVSGYYVWGNFEWGPYFSILSSNSVEGIRLKGGFRTSNAFSTRWMFGGYIAYGTKDKDFKYAFETFCYITKTPRQAVGFIYKNDLNLASQHIDEFGSDNLFSGYFRRNIPMRLIRIEEYNAYYLKEWKTGLSVRSSFIYRYIDPYEHSSFLFQFPDITTYQNIGESVNTSEASWKLRYAYQEKFISGEFERISLGSKYPIIELNYIAGMKGVLQSDFAYHKISVEISDFVTVNPFGKFKYILSAGKIFNPLPYLLLETHNANETYYYIGSAFNNMRRYEFTSDEYIKLFFSHYFNGYLLDKVPLIKKLKWRSLLSYKAVLGRLSNENETLNSLNNIKTPFPKPYMEASAGIENIFRIFRIDAIWRLSYLNTTDAVKFGLRGSIQFEF